jgi:hypothetical protein
LPKKSRFKKVDDYDLATLAEGLYHPTSQEQLKTNETREQILSGGDEWWDLDPELLKKYKNLNKNNKEDNNKKKKQSFDDAFAAARKAGKATFTWEGKSYHTRRADESKEDWQKKFKTDKPSPGKEPKKTKYKRTIKNIPTTTTSNEEDDKEAAKEKRARKGNREDVITKRYKTGEVKKVKGKSGWVEYKEKWKKGDYEDVDEEGEGARARKLKATAYHDYEGKKPIKLKEKRKTYKGVDLLKSKQREKGKLFGTKTYYKTDSKGNVLKDEKGNPVTTTKKEIRQQKRKERKENRKKRKENK